MSLSAQNVTVVKHGRTILDNVSVDAPAGLVTGLIGPNGAGKSTLLAALSGDLACAGGRVDIAGRDASTSSARDLARLRSVMRQNVDVAFTFLVRDVVAMGRHPWGRSSRDALLIDASLEATGLFALQDREVSTLSGGERARAAFARVLAQQTPVVLLDEPTAAMDVRYQELTMGTARALAQAGAAVVVVLHDLQLAARYCDRVVCLKGGRVAAAGDVGEVYRDEILSDVYGWPIRVERAGGALFVLPGESSGNAPAIEVLVSATRHPTPAYPQP